MQEAKGGILFIDEAYDMHPHQNLFGDEIMTVLMQSITNEEYKGKLVVVLAGYSDKIQLLFDFNPGFASRFNKQNVIFPEWNAENATQCVLNLIKDDGKTIDEDAIPEMKSGFEILCQLPNWGSARDAKENIYPGLLRARSSRQNLVTRQLRGEAKSVVAASHSAAAKATRPPPISYSLEDVKSVFATAIGLRDQSAGTNVKEITSDHDFDAYTRVEGLVVVDFFADWCPPCREAAPIFENLSKQHGDVTFLKINEINNNSDLAETKKKMKINGYPTFVFMKGGRKIDQLDGFNESKLCAKIKEHSKSGKRPAFELDGGNGGAKAAAPPPPKVEVKVDKKVFPPNPPGKSNVLSGLDRDKIWAMFEQILTDKGYDLATIKDMFSTETGFPPSDILREVMDRLDINPESETDVSAILKEKRPEILIMINKSSDGSEDKEEAKCTPEEKSLKKLIPRLCNCPMGFAWRREGRGWRCLGGSHAVTDEQLRREYMKIANDNK